MVSWWKTDLYLNNEHIKIGDIEIMNASYGSSGSFGSRVRSKYIGHKTCTGIRRNLRSKQIPIHGTVHRSDLNYSYSISHFIRLPQEVAKKRIYHLYQKVSYSSKRIYPVISIFITN